MGEKNKPVIKLSDRGVVVAVFANAAKDGKTYYNAVLSKSYHDGQAWRDTHTINQVDMLRAARLLERAYDQTLGLEKE